MVNLIIPIYKGRDTLPQALNSLVAQTKKMFLITIVQDCDGEDYSDIISKYQDLGLHINLISTDHNGGPGYARRTGILNNTMCDAVMFMDCDDMLMPRAIEVLYSGLKRGNRDIVASNFIYEDSKGFGQLYEKQELWLHGKIYSVEFLKKIDLNFLEESAYNEDAYFNGVAFNCDPNVRWIDEITYLWGRNPKSLTRDKDLNFMKYHYTDIIKSAPMIIRKIMKVMGCVSVDLIMTQLAIMHTYYCMAHYYNLDLTEADEIIKSFLNEDYIVETISSKKGIKLLIDNFKTGLNFQNISVIFKITPHEWIHKFNPEIKLDLE